MNGSTWLDIELGKYHRAIDTVDRDSLFMFVNLLDEVIQSRKRIFAFGNGGSEAACSHFCTDLKKNLDGRCFHYASSSLLTCFSNDYGYDQCLSRIIDVDASKDDVVILVSSSGNSQNMLNAVLAADRASATVITFTGFSSDNPLRDKGSINFWCDSSNYNVVETTHQLWLLLAIDFLRFQKGRL